MLFKSLLEPSWADLRAFWPPSWVPKCRSGISRRSISWIFTFFVLIGFQIAFKTELGRSWAPKVPRMTPSWLRQAKIEPKSSQKNDQNLDRKKDGQFGFIWSARRNAQRSWRDYREVRKLRQNDFAVICDKLWLRVWQLWRILRLRLGIWHAVALAPTGRAADCLPFGGTPPPARYCSACLMLKNALSLSAFAMSACT